MCIAFIKVAKSLDERYKLIVLNNRDESLDRPTAKMQWNDNILCGTDEQDPARGTWLGIDKYGTVGILLSVTQPAHTKHLKAPSRGSIIKEFLQSKDRDQFFVNLQNRAHQFNGFQFVSVQKSQDGLYQVESLTNHLVEKVEPIQWSSESATRVFSNSPPDIPLLKTIYGQKIFDHAMQNSDNMTNEEIFSSLIKIATDRESTFPDRQLEKQTGFGDDYNKPLCSIFVRFPNGFRYGTRSHTIITVDQNDNVTVLERRLIPSDNIEESTWEDENFSFKLEA
ncbi:unnamed protein product [Caenorhabditis bovis]|uniref:Transport and Golgi organization protein 2 n=1 Tax=Caenorhabditis bovis TaxID=2654633 RepID=A0A8S1EBI2_9PELO|nr:unnamed protein product [Caenorhabditis bovis]